MTIKNRSMCVWHVPITLSKRGRTAAKLIRDFCRSNNLTSGMPAFADPKHQIREYGRDSLLLVDHENTDASRAMSWDGAYELNNGNYELYEQLTELLSQHGFLMEQCTRTYSAVYEL